MTKREWDGELVCDKLAARALVYRALQSAFGAEPTDEQIGIILSETVSEALRIMGGANGGLGDSSAGAYAEAVTAYESLRGELPAAISLRREYVRLFIGPATLPAPLWESMYQGGDKTLFTKTTLEVRNSYRRRGFIPAEYPHVADDHIAIELDFLFRLAQKALDAQVEGHVEDARTQLAAAAVFMDEHLLRWISQFADLMHKHSPSGYYGAMARLCESFLQIDRGYLSRVAFP